MHHPARIPLLVALAGVVVSTPGTGQSSPRLIPSWEIGITSRHVWRGITRHRGAAGQAQVGLTRTGKVADLSLTGWSSVVSDQCDHCSQVLGLTVAELSASFLTTWHPRFKPLQAVDVLTGVSAYSSGPAPWDPTESRGSTAELLLGLSSRPSRHALVALTAWMDIGEVKGTYFEGSLTIPFTLSQGRNPRLYVTGTLGVNGGQLQTEEELGYFTDRGPVFGSLQLNYLPFWTADPCKYRGSVQLWVRLQGNFDQSSKQRRPGEGRAREQRLWVGAQWRGSMGKVIPPEWCRKPSILDRRS